MSIKSFCPKHFVSPPPKKDTCHLAAANEISWLGFRDLGEEFLPQFPELPPLPEGLFHRIRDNSQDPCSRSQGVSIGKGGSVGKGGSRPPPGGRSHTPGPRERGSGKGVLQEGVNFADKNFMYTQTFLTDG